MEDTSQLVAMKLFESQWSSFGNTLGVFELTGGTEVLALDNHPSALIQQASPVPEPTAVDAFQAGFDARGVDAVFAIKGL